MLTPEPIFHRDGDHDGPGPYFFIGMATMMANMAMSKSGHAAHQQRRAGDHTHRGPFGRRLATCLLELGTDLVGMCTISWGAPSPVTVDLCLDFYLRPSHT